MCHTVARVSPMLDMFCERESAMKAIVGKQAGQVWLYLGEKGATDLAQLARKMKLKGQDAYQGLGWLAREDKVEYHQHGEKVMVALAPCEQANFDAHAKKPGV